MATLPSRLPTSDSTEHPENALGLVYMRKAGGGVATLHPELTHPHDEFRAVGPDDWQRAPNSGRDHSG